MVPSRMVLEGMKYASLVRSPSAIAIALGPLLLCVVFLCLHGQWIISLCEGSGDYVLGLLDIEKASRFEAYAGPYSRFRVRHPSPTLSYLLAGLTKGLHLSGSARGSVSLAQLVINTVLLCAATVAMVRSGVTVFWALVTFYVFVFLCSMTLPGVLADIWGPCAVVAPVFCFLCVVPLIARGAFEWTFWLVVSGCLALSSHMGTVAVVCPVSLLVVASLWCRRRQLPARTRLAAVSAVAAGLFAAACLAPPVIDALRNSGGNLLRVVRFLVLSPGSARRLGLSAAPEFLGYFLSAPLGLPAWLGALVLLMLVFVVIRRHILRPSEARVEAVTVFVACVGAVAGAASIRGAPHQYLMLYMSGVVALLVSVAGRASSVVRHRARPSTLMVVALLMGCALVSASVPARRNEPSGSTCGEELEPFVTHFGLHKSQRVELRPAGAASWQALSSSVYRLYREGYTTCVPRRWSFLFGDELTCPRGEGMNGDAVRFAVFDSSESSVPGLAFQSGRIAWLQE